MDFFKNLLGFPSQSHPEDPRRPETFFPPQPFQEEPSSQESQNFNIFTDPLEMHRYFENQIENMLKSFGMPGFGGSEPPGFGTLQPEYHAPDSREFYLKPKQPSDKVDEDLDGKLSVNDLDRLLKNPHQTEQPVVPIPRMFGGNRFFNQSTSVKTIRNPDGSVETHKTVTDSEGNRETTVTKKQGEKEYTIIKRRDKDGKEEVHENMINMSEDEKYLFDTKKSQPDPSRNDYLFDKFFK